MSWRSKGLPLVISAIFIIQIISPLLVFPVEESLSENPGESNSVGFSSGSGHEIEGDLINLDGKNWTVRGESVLDHWTIDSLGYMSNKAMDLVVTELGIGYACSINSSDVNLHTIHLNGSVETLLVESLTNGAIIDECGVAIGTNNRIQVIYNVDDDLRLARLVERNVVYMQRTWHLRTIAEDVFSSGLEISFDSEFKSHIMFQNLDLELHHLWFNKAFWNHTILDSGPVGDDIELAIDSEDIIHVVYTNPGEGEVRLIKFNDTMEYRQVLVRGSTVSSAVGMDLDSNNVEQITYSSSDGTGNNTVSLLRSLSGKDVGRIDPNPSAVINYANDSIEGELLAGDLNGDGYDDIVYTDSEGYGEISIHYGSPDGIASEADLILVGSNSESKLGTGIAIGDFNCDGFDDIASSEPGLVANNSGHVSIKLGSDTGLSNTTWWELNGSASDNLGWSLASIGDVESDGCTDLAIVADKMILEDTITPSLSQNGLVMVLKGNDTSMMFHANITQTGSGTMFGRQVIGNGDLNGDGFLDLVVSNTGAIDNPTGYSSVEFFLGDSYGINTTAVKVHAPLTSGKLYGAEMSMIGDVNGDGFDEILVSEIFADTTPFHTGKIHMWSFVEGNISRTWNIKGDSANALLGQTISPAGDINEDGYDDFLVMAPSASKSGKVYLYLGSQNGPRIETQTFAQGSAGENVGLNLLAGIDVNGDGMGELIYSSRDLDLGEEFGSVLTIMSERDWEYIDFNFNNPVVSLEMHTPLRGTPSIMAMLNDSSLLLAENTLDGTPSGRWLTRELTTAQHANIGISNSGKPTILYHSSGEIKSLSLTGNTAIELALATGNGIGKEMDSATDSSGYQRLGHFSPDFSSIFYTEESATGFTTTTVRTSIDLAYPIGIHVDSQEMTRMVYVDDDDYMVRMATLNGSWTETSILNTTTGDDFESTLADNDVLMFVQVAVSNNSTMLQFVEYADGNTTVTDIIGANTTSQFELELLDDKVVISLIDSDYLFVLERPLTGGNWSVASETWLLGVTEGHNLAMNSDVILFDANNTVQGILVEDGNGTWDFMSMDIPDSSTNLELSIKDGRWHTTSTNEENQLVWTTGLVQLANNPVFSTAFPAITTLYSVPIEHKDDGTVMLAYSESSSNDFYAMRFVQDTDRDLIPDSHDLMPDIGNQWADSDSDGYGDNQFGPEFDSCPSDSGDSYIDQFGCEDFDNDGWSDVSDDCVNDDGMSWWGQVGCDDDDQDGWVDDSILGDRFPENWKQALDTDRDTFGDNHGPDCCYATLEGILRVGDLFPYNALQYQDTDGDGYGDNSDDPVDGDWCFWLEGYSWRDRNGCPDQDGDGASDPWYIDNEYGEQWVWTEEDGADWWPEDGTQWADSDGDGYGDNSSVGATLPDKFPTRPAAAIDTDNDGYPNNWTSLKNDSNYGGLYLDNCPDEYGNSTSSVTIEGSVVEYYGCIDTDGDGREDSTDSFPDDSTQLSDSDGDGWGDNQQGNEPDECPYDSGVFNGTLGVGCPILGDEVDTDEDGVSDELDNCNNTMPGQEVDSVGCSEYQKDDDQDLVSNADDKCPNTPSGEGVDNIGCSNSQKDVDTDGDGIFDPYDACPDSNPELTIDENGCNLAQKDTDGDTINDLVDECPGTGSGTPVLANGCDDEAALAEDIDGDGRKGNYSYDPVTDSHVGDAFPLDDTQWENRDGDEYGDNQTIGANNSDDCPDVWGNSTMKSLFGCPDTDGDGYSDNLGHDKFPLEKTQWEDKDLDNWGDNPDGVDPDQCLETEVSGDLTAQARINFGCADYQSDSDGDGVSDDIDACMNTEAGATVSPRGCKIEEAQTVDDEVDQILGIDSNLFITLSGIAGLFIIVLAVVIVRRLGGNELDLEDDDDWDDDEDDEDDFMSSVMGRNQSRASSASSGPSRGPSGGAGPSRGPPGGAGPSRGPPGGAGPSRGPPGGAGPSRGPPGGAGPSRGPPGGASPSRGPPGVPNSVQPASLDPRGPARGPSKGKKVAKRKPIGDKVRKTKLIIDPDLFSQQELVDRVAAVDWTKGALEDGTDERSILMQLQTTGWSAPQSRAIIDLSKK